MLAMEMRILIPEKIIDPKLIFFAFDEILFAVSDKLFASVAILLASLAISFASLVARSYLESVFCFSVKA